MSNHENTALRIFEKLKPATSSSLARMTLSERGLNPEGLSTAVLGIAPSQGALRECGLEPWLARRAAGMMMATTFTSEGVPRSFRARRTDGGMVALKGGRKTKSASIGSSSGTVMATAGGLAMLRGELSPDVVIIGEGEGDLWVWEMLSPQTAYLGAVSGSACEAVAAKIPDDCDVILRHHLDGGGDKMAEKWARLLQDRTNLWRISGKDGDPDDGDRWKLGTLNISDPFDGCRRYTPPALPNYDKEFNKRRASILEATSRFPTERADIKTRQRVEGYVSSVLASMTSQGKGGRALAIFSHTHSIAGVCAWAEGLMSSSEGGALTSEMRLMTDMAAVGMMGGRERREALEQVKSGWRKGSGYPLALEDEYFAPDQLNEQIQRRAQEKTIERKRTERAFADVGEVAPVVPRVDIHDVRIKLDKVLRDAIEGNGITIIIAPCGSGKSHVARKYTIERLANRRGELRAVVSLPTKDLGREMADGFSKVAEEIGVILNIRQAVTRTPLNCVNFDAIKRANTAAPSGGSVYCRKACPLSWKLWSGEGETPCPWARANKSTDDTDILVNTHALETRRDPLNEDKDAVFRVDWPSFNHIAEQGFPASPIVIRSSSFSIRAKRDESGTPVPKEKLVVKSAMCAQSQRETLAWLLQSLKVEMPEGDLDYKKLREMMDHQARLMTNAPKETRVFVRWSAIGDAYAQGGILPVAVPVVEVYKDGWLSGIHVSIQLVDEGEPLPEIIINHRMTRSDKNRLEVLDWIARSWDVMNDRESLKEEAIKRVTIYPTDLTIFDESLWGQANRGGTATLAQVGRCIESGEISGDLASELMKIMSECLEDRKEMNSHQILSRIPVDGIEADPGKTGKEVLEGLKPNQSLDDHVQRLDGIIQWEVTEGILRAAANNWRGARITKMGEINTSWIRPIETRHSRSTVCLDATATPEIARACFGGREIEIQKIELDHPEFTTNTWVVMETGTNANCFDSDSLAGRSRILAVQMEYGGEETLVVSHKKHVVKGEGVFKMIEADGSAIIHHNGTLARGSNKFEAFSKTIIHDYHAPRGAIRIQAEALAIALDENISNKATKKKLEEEVRYQLEVAPVRQAAQRIRANLSHEGNEKEIVFISTVSPTRFGYFPDKVVDPDHLVRKHLGMSPKNTMGMVMSDLFDHLKGGGYMPTIALQDPGDLILGDLISNEAKRRIVGISEVLGEDLIDAINSDMMLTVARRCSLWVKAALRFSWVAFAARCKISIAMIETSKGGQATPYLYRGGLDRIDVTTWLAPKGIKWWRVRGESQMFPVRDIEEITWVLGRMNREMINASTVGVALGLIAHFMKMSGPSCARDYLMQYQLEGEDLRQCIARLWQSAQAQKNAREISRRTKEGESQAVALAGVKSDAVAIAMPWEVKEIASVIGESEVVPSWILKG